VRSLDVCTARDDNCFCRSYIICACATFPLHATNEETQRGSSRDRAPYSGRHSRARGRIVRQQAQENLRAHANAGAAETHEEEIHRRKVGDAEIDGNAGEIAVAKEKAGSESDSVRDAISECFCVSEKEEVFAEPISGIFSERVEQKKETKNFPHADSESDAE
jgi:hypothetical protein